MAKRLFVALLAVFALIAVSCEKEDGPSGNDEKVTSADLVGTWLSDGTPAFVFNGDGTYKDVRWGENIAGSWTMSDNKLTCIPNGGEAWNVKVVLTGGKAWLVLISEYGTGSEMTRSYECFIKEGATVDSGKLSDGRWDASHSGVKPEAYTPDADYSFCMVIKGKTVDLYVPMWGFHIQGTYTLANGKMHIETDNDHIWTAAYRTGDDRSGSIGWNAWGPPTDETPATWDDSYGSMNAETFALQSPYSWYTITQILAMGKKPDPNDPEYKKEPYLFKFMLYEWGESQYDVAMSLCDFYLCVASNGKEAYGGVVGLNLLVCKR